MPIRTISLKTTTANSAFAKAGLLWLNKVHRTFQHFEVYKIHHSQSPPSQMRGTLVVSL